MKDVNWWNVVCWFGVGLLLFLFVFSKICTCFSSGAKVQVQFWDFRRCKFGILGKCSKWTFGKVFSKLLVQFSDKFLMQMYRKFGYISSDKKKQIFIETDNFIHVYLCFGYCVWVTVWVSVLRSLACFLKLSQITRAPWSFFLLPLDSSLFTNLSMVFLLGGGGGEGCL